MSDLMQREFPGWGRRRSALHPARLSLSSQTCASGAWLWDPSLLARDCLHTVALELVWGPEVLRFGLPAQGGCVSAALLGGLRGLGWVIVNNTSRSASLQLGFASNNEEGVSSFLNGSF